MDFKNLEEFVKVLEENNQLVRIQTFVDPVLQITEIVDRISKNHSQNVAILFENTGTNFPLLINSMGNLERIKLALRVQNIDDLSNEIEEIFHKLTAPKTSLMSKIAMIPELGKISSYMPKVKSGKGECQDVIHLDPDLSMLPILKCWPLDGGLFITLPSVHTKDPITGVRNIGMYRMQVFEQNLTGMHWHKHKVSARHYEAYKKLGKRMPVAVALGGDPVYTYSATAPLPDQVDEYILAGFLRKRKVELVKCITQPDIEVPTDADIIIEGYVEPNEEKIWEGPFGDHTGFYSLPDWYPRFHVTAITHKRNAIYPATIVGIPPQEDAWIGKATEKIFLSPIKLTMIPEIEDMHMPIEGVFHNLVIAKINKDYAGQAMKVMNAMWGAGQMMFNKMLVIIDGEIDLENYALVAKHLFDHMIPEYDIHMSVGPMDVLDHSCSALGFGGKVCFDGTVKSSEELSGREQRTYLSRDTLSIFMNHISEVDGISQVNTDLLEMDIPCVIIGVRKTKKHQVKSIHESITSMHTPLPKLIIYITETKNIQSISDVLWYWCNNVDPSKNAWCINGCMGMDGSRKTKELDDFHRNWPNIICSTDQTIKEVDEMWDTLGLGPMIPSPSLKYKNDFIGDQAEASYNEN